MQNLWMLLASLIYNLQFKIKIFILEVNPRGSRTIPFVAKSTGFPCQNCITNNDW